VEYGDLVRTYQIIFTSHTVFKKSPGFVSRFSMRDEHGKQFTDQINQIIIELSKLNDIIKKPVEELTAFEKWLLFLRFAPDTMQRNKINDIIREKEEIGMASAILQEISQDEKEKARIRSRKMAEMDNYSNMKVLERMEKRGEERANKKWEGVVAEKDAELIDKDNEIARLHIQIAELEANRNSQD